MEKEAKASAILNKVLDMAEEYMEDQFTEAEISKFTDLFEGTEAFFNIRDEIKARL